MCPEPSGGRRSNGQVIFRRFTTMISAVKTGNGARFEGLILSTRTRTRNRGVFSVRREMTEGKSSKSVAVGQFQAMAGRRDE